MSSINCMQFNVRLCVPVSSPNDDALSWKWKSNFASINYLLFASSSSSCFGWWIYAFVHIRMDWWAERDCLNHIPNKLSISNFQIGFLLPFASTILILIWFVDCISSSLDLLKKYFRGSIFNQIVLCIEYFHIQNGIAYQNLDVHRYQSCLQYPNCQYSVQVLSFARSK